MINKARTKIGAHQALVQPPRTEDMGCVDEEHRHRRRLARATRRLGELKDTGVPLSELLGGEAGAAFVQDDCEGDVDLAFAAFTVVFSWSTHKRWEGEEGQGERSERLPAP